LTAGRKRVIINQRNSTDSRNGVLEIFSRMLTVFPYRNTGFFGQLSTAGRM